MQYQVVIELAQHWQYLAAAVFHWCPVVYISSSLDVATEAFTNPLSFSAWSSHDIHFFRLR
jgi:hypothetical protein